MAGPRLRAADHRLGHGGTVGVDQPGGTLQGLATIPDALWELFLGVYCTVSGLRRDAPILSGEYPKTRGPKLTPGDASIEPLPAPS